MFNCDCMEFLPSIQDEKIDLIITSPPYNLGKEYEKNINLEIYRKQQKQVIDELVRVLKPNGSLCYQVGNYVQNGTVLPLDIFLYDLFTRQGLCLRNRIIWTFNHGLHATYRFSGRHETILWFTKGPFNKYTFNLDSVRIPQKYPNKKHFKGPKKGKLSCNPLGKNPGDVWEITNVKGNHPEKTEHPCQFPEELVERLVLSLTNPNDIVLDPFAGSGTVGVVCERLNREHILIEKEESYCKIAENRINKIKEQGVLV